MKRHVDRTALEPASRSTVATHGGHGRGLREQGRVMGADLLEVDPVQEGRVGEVGEQEPQVLGPGREETREAAQAQGGETAEGGKVFDVELAAEEQTQAVRAAGHHGGAEEVVHGKQAREVDGIFGERGATGQDAAAENPAGVFEGLFGLEVAVQEEW